MGSMHGFNKGGSDAAHPPHLLQKTPLLINNNNNIKHYNYDKYDTYYY